MPVLAQLCEQRMRPGGGPPRATLGGVPADGDDARPLPVIVRYLNDFSLRRECDVRGILADVASGRPGARTEWVNFLDGEARQAATRGDDEHLAACRNVYDRLRALSDGGEA
jgi:hypothetical protein